MTAIREFLIWLGWWRDSTPELDGVLYPPKDWS